eukprot:jgi/Mesen1/10552/ME000083S10054
MSLLFEKSRTWRFIVAKSRESRGFFFAFSAVCVGVPLVLGAAVMAATNPGGESAEKRHQQLLSRGRSDASVMGEVNKDRLGQFLMEIHSKQNTEDRYAAALRGETLTGSPEARVRGGGGSSIHHPKFSSAPAKAPTTSAASSSHPAHGAASAQ